MSKIVYLGKGVIIFFVKFPEFMKILSLTEIDEANKLIVFL